MNQKNIGWLGHQPASALRAVGRLSLGSAPDLFEFDGGQVEVTAAAGAPFEHGDRDTALARSPALVIAQHAGVDRPDECGPLAVEGGELLVDLTSRGAAPRQPPRPC